MTPLEEARIEVQEANIAWALASTQAMAAQEAEKRAQAAYEDAYRRMNHLEIEVLRA